MEEFMKKIGRALFCAACLSLLAASLYAAPKAKAPKDIWVAKEKKGNVGDNRRKRLGPSGLWRGS